MFDKTKKQRIRSIDTGTTCFCPKVREERDRYI